jgi:hypothetical protein
MRPTCRGGTRREISFPLVFIKTYRVVPTSPICAWFPDFGIGRKVAAIGFAAKRLVENSRHPIPSQSNLKS